MKAKFNINPVLRKELKTKMRGWRAAFVIMLYLVIMVAFALMMLSASGVNSLYGYNSINPQNSVMMYASIASMQFALILFIVPSLTAGAISGEREKQTLDLLLSTTMTPMQIVRGKLEACLSHVLLLIIAAVPVFSIVFLFGGISFGQVLLLTLYYLHMAIMIGCVAIYFSVRLKKTTGATVMTYAVGAFMIAGTVFITLLWAILNRNNMGMDKMLPWNYINPVVGFVSFIEMQIGAGSVMVFPGVKELSFYGMTIRPWVVNCVFNLVLSVILLRAAAKRLSPEYRRRKRKS